MRIDSHQHFTDRHVPEHLAPILKRNRFDGSVLVGQSWCPASRLLELASRHDFILGFLAPVILDHPKFRGVCLNFEDEIPCVLGELERRNLCLDLLLRPHQLPQVARIAERFPRLHIAIGHLAQPGFQAPMTDEWARGMEEAARAPEVCVKISGLLSGATAPWTAACFRPFVQHALAVFGLRRLMFGSDWPSSLPAFGWKESLAAFTQSIGAQTIEVREELLGGTARRFYGL